MATPVCAKDRRLRSFREEVTVLPNATVDVTENITFEFIGGPWHGIYRNIPVEYSGPNGLNYSLFLDVKHVTEDGVPLKYETSRQRQYLQLKIQGDFVQVRNAHKGYAVVVSCGLFSRVRVSSPQHASRSG